MRRWHTQWQLILTCTFLLIWLVGAILTQPGVVFSAPLAQNETVNLNYGEEYLSTLGANSHAETFYQVNIPAGEQLMVAVGTDEQGGCYWRVRIMVNGYDVASAYVGAEPNTWSDLATATLPNGSAQVIAGADTSCAGVTFKNPVPSPRLT